MTRKNWSIILAERNVEFNAKADLNYYGKPFSHPFLALVSSQGEVAAEIHGTWFKKTPLYPMLYVANHATSATRASLSPAFARVAGPVLPKAHIMEVQGNRNFERAPAKYRQILMEGSEEACRELWTKITDQIPAQLGASKAFHQYARLGTAFANCQVMLRETIARSKVFPTIPPLHLAQTGWQA